MFRAAEDTSVPDDRDHISGGGGLFQIEATANHAVHAVDACEECSRNVVH